MTGSALSGYVESEKALRLIRDGRRPFQGRSTAENTRYMLAESLLTSSKKGDRLV